VHADECQFSRLGVGWLCSAFVTIGRDLPLFQIAEAKAPALINADRIVAATFDVPSLVDWDSHRSAIAGCEYSGVCLGWYEGAHEAITNLEFS
jgi:hypothetical protein